MQYPIKLIGLAGDELLHAVRAIILKHFPEFDLATL
jgi:putative lipoic acid-binding regulatory protein